MNALRTYVFDIYRKFGTGTNHNLEHVLRVWDNAQKIVKLLNVEAQIDKELLEVACLIHDIGIVKHRFGLISYFFEGSFARKEAEKILQKFKYPKEKSELILHAVGLHPLSVPFAILNKKEDLYTQILQDADTLEYFHPARMEAFMSKRRLFKPLNFYRIIAQKYLNFGRKNIKIFLNFPQIADSFSLTTQ